MATPCSVPAKSASDIVKNINKKSIIIINNMVQSEREELTEAEAELYDRQIRLWGLDSQKRLRASKILLVGLKGFGAEIAKNVILAGVKSITFLDSESLSEVDALAQFLAPKEKIGTNRAEASKDRAQALNPMVVVSIDKTPIADLPDSYFTGFDVVCVTDCPQRQLARINNVCRTGGVKFFCGNVWGFFGFMFADLQVHEFAEDVVQHKPAKSSADGKKNKGETITTTVKQTTTFVSLESALDVDWSDKKYSGRLRRGDPSYFVTKVLLNFQTQMGRNPDPERRDEDIASLLSMRDTLMEECSVPKEFVPDELLTNVFGEISPSCAIVGGVLAQEIIKAVSQKEAPHNNMFFFNPLKCVGFVESYGE